MTEYVFEACNRLMVILSNLKQDTFSAWPGYASEANDERKESFMFVCVALGVGADPSKPQCRKAKDVRKERRLQKEHQKKQDGGGTSTNPKPAPATPASGQPKPLEDFITDSLPDEPLHRLEVRNCLDVRFCSKRTD